MKNYHHPKVYLIERCFKVTKNLGEHSRSKMHMLKPGPDYYQLLQSAKIYILVTLELIEVSPQTYLETKYQLRPNTIKC